MLVPTSFEELRGHIASQLHEAAAFLGATTGDRHTMTRSAAESCLPTLLLPLMLLRQLVPLILH